jgi:hypothetical protein
MSCEQVNLSVPVTNTSTRVTILEAIVMRTGINSKCNLQLASLQVVRWWMRGWVDSERVKL